VTGLLQGKVAIVTGGGWNIGRAIAQRFAREGAAVAVSGRRAALLDESVGAIRAEGGRALAVPADATQRPAMEDLARRTLETFGAIDVVAAIAGGGGGYEPLDVIDPDWWEHVVAINLFATFHVVRAALPALRARNRGSIITCSGGGAWFPVLGVPCTAYASAKAAICRFTDQLAVELLETGIRVNCLQPGLTWDAARLAAVEEEERRTGRAHPERAVNHSPEDAAELATWLASDASAPLTGRLVSVDEDWWRDPAQVRAVCASHHACCLRRAGLPS
jgi:3-oxoacyl-[acyl-carrier protein] reductase